MSWFAAACALIAVIIYGWFENRANEKRAAEAAAVAYVERQKMVKALFSGAAPELLYSSVGDFEFLRPKMIADSIIVIMQTTNKGTRASRLRLIEGYVRGLEVEGWPGLNGESRSILLAASARIRQQACFDEAVQAFGKNIEACNRSTRKPTKLKYLLLAKEAVVDAKAEVVDDDLIAKLDTLIAAVTVDDISTSEGETADQLPATLLVSPAPERLQ